MSHWPQEEISSLGTVVTGTTPLTSDESFYGGDIPFVTPSELDRIEPVVASSRTLSEAGGRVVRLLPEGSVMVCCIGSLGKIGIAGREVATNQQINSIVFDSQRIWPRFGFYACRRLKSKLETMAPATTVPIVSKSKFERLRIPVPPLAEQRRIAEVLDRAEALRAKRRAALAQLNTLTQSIFLDLFGDPRVNPMGFKVARLEDLCTRVTDGTHQPPEWATTGHPFLFVSNIISGEISFDTEKFISDETHASLTRRCPIEVGDVLYSTVGSYGVPALVKTHRKFAFQRHIAHIKPNPKYLNSEFLRAMLASPPLRRQADRAVRGIAQKTLNLADLSQFMVFCPPLGAQSEFAKKSMAIAELKKRQETSLIELDALFTSLQSRLFRGDL